MAYKNKTYVCFDGDNDIHYYRLMKAWHQSDSSAFSFYDAHDLNYARDSSQESSIKAQLRVRLANSKVFVVLLGENTRYLYKFVRWEMEQAIYLGLPIICVNLNGLRQQDSSRCPPVLRDELAIHISYGPRIMQYALEEWPMQHSGAAAQGKRGPFYYGPQIYYKLGL